MEFVNSDAKMISVFMKYFRSKNIDDRRVRGGMTIHVQDNEAECKEHWKKVTTLEDSNFINRR